MAGITLAQAEAQLALYLAAEEAVLANQSYEIAGRKLTRADLERSRPASRCGTPREDLAERSVRRPRALAHHRRGGLSMGMSNARPSRTSSRR
jgi:hypothetical protein